MAYQRSFILLIISFIISIIPYLWLCSSISPHNLWKMVKQHVSKLHDPNVHRNPSVLAATNLSWPQRYRYSRPIFFPFSNLLAIDTQIAIPSIRGLSSWIVQTCSSNLSPLFPYSFASPLLCFPPPSEIPPSVSNYRLFGTSKRVNGSTQSRFQFVLSLLS